MQVACQSMSRLSAVCAGVMLALAGCKQTPELPTIISPYKIDIQQGNIITQEMLSKLKAGMTRAQVRFVLGSPLVVDPFRGDRWDYVSLYQRQGKDVERRRVTVIFDDDKLIRIEGDVTLTDNALAPEPVVEKTPLKTVAPVEFAKPAAVVKPAAVAPVVAKPEALKPPPAAPAVQKTEPVKPVVAAPEKIEPVAEVPKMPAAKPEAAKAEPAAEVQSAEATKAAVAAGSVDEKKAEAAKKDAAKEKPKPGFFGRMLDKLGI